MSTTQESSGDLSQQVRDLRATLAQRERELEDALEARYRAVEALNAPTSQVQRLEWLLTSLKEMMQEREDAEEEIVVLRKRVRRLRTERDMARQEALAVLRKEIAGLLGNGTADELPQDGEYTTALNDVLGLLDELEGETK